ncbi:hypothetical protein ACIQTX_02010 [Microbacterium sp. NPDC090281]|uniref:hypothetical protein n=1 Tax=Microbacterium sp. NPDC090281 TaxID=3364208 RepID=UPI00380CF8E8
MTNADRRRNLGWWFVLLSALGAALIWFVFIGQYADGREIEGKCFGNVPPGAVVTEDSSAYEADITFLPPGRQCTYAATDGGTITTQTGESRVPIAFLATGLGLLALVLTWVFRRRATAMQQVLTHSALLFLGLGWATMAIYANG